MTCEIPLSLRVAGKNGKKSAQAEREARTLHTGNVPKTLTGAGLASVHPDKKAPAHGEEGKERARSGQVASPESERRRRRRVSTDNKSSSRLPLFAEH